MDSRERIEEKHVKLLNAKSPIFEGDPGNGIHGSKKEYILNGNSDLNLYKGIRENAKNYFKTHNIQFQSGKKFHPTPNTLSSQVACLNFLFLIKDDKVAVKRVINSLLKDAEKDINIAEVLPVPEYGISSKDNGHYISFEAVSKIKRMKETHLSRGSGCTSIDALVIGKDEYGKTFEIVMEWKLVENDSGNMAPSDTMKKAYASGKNRIDNYQKDILSLNSIFNLENVSTFEDSDFFKAPFYELMRQTIWSNINKADFGVDDYIHLLIIPEDNHMVQRNYVVQGNKVKGIGTAWSHLLTANGKKHFGETSPEVIIKILEESDKYKELANYLKIRY